MVVKTVTKAPDMDEQLIQWSIVALWEGEMAPACVPRRHIHLCSVCFIVFVTFIDLTIHNDLMIRRVSIHRDTISWLFLVIIIICFMNTASRLLSQGDARVWGTFFGVSRSAQASRLISFRVIIPINPLSADGFSAGPALPKRSSLSPQWCAASRKTTSAVVFLKENPEKACNGCQELFCGFVGTTMTFL